MAQTGYTPISLYYSATAAAVPTNSNLANGELAINITDGKLYYKDNTGTVQLLASSAGSGGSFTNMTVSGNLTLSGGTANGVTYLNGSKVLTSGSALTFDGTNFATTGNITSGGVLQALTTVQSSSGADLSLNANGANRDVIYKVNATELMRLVGSTGNLGIGTSSPNRKLEVASSTAALIRITSSAASGTGYVANEFYNGAGFGYCGTESSTAGTLFVGTTAYATILGNTAAYPIQFATNNTVRATLDSAGNLGLGVTPTSVQSGYKAIQIGATVGGGIVSAGTDTYFTNNAYVTGGSWYFGSTGYAMYYNQSSGVHSWTTSSASGTAGGVATMTERFRIAPTGAFGLSGANYGTSGQVLTSQGSGSPPIWAAGGSGSSQWTTNGSDIYYNTGKVGIGVSTPLQILQTRAQDARIRVEDNRYDSGTIGIEFNNGYLNNTPKTAIMAVATGGAYGVSDLAFYASPTGNFSWSSTYERMRIDSNGRVGIGTTSATANLARLQIDHSPTTDSYGVYVPGGSYVGSGPAYSYGGYFMPHVSNSQTASYGVYGSANPNQTGPIRYGGYFHGQNCSSTTSVGVYGTANQSDNNGPAVAYGGWFSVTTSNPATNYGGGMVPVRAESLANKGGSNYAIWASTLPGATTINGYYYEHNNALQCRIKSNGGIDNYSANNTNLSDRREKKDFAPARSYLDAICAIPVQTFLYIDQQDDLPNLGVVAQDVQAVAPELVVESNWAKLEEEPKMRLSVYETDLVYALMKSLQELKAQFDEYKASHP